jgi:hypothetical protein
MSVMRRQSAHGVAHRGRGYCFLADAARAFLADAAFFGGGATAGSGVSERLPAASGAGVPAVLGKSLSSKNPRTILSRALVCRLRFPSFGQIDELARLVNCQPLAPACSGRDGRQSSSRRQCSRQGAQLSLAWLLEKAPVTSE